VNIYAIFLRGQNGNHWDQYNHLKYRRDSFYEFKQFKDHIKIKIEKDDEISSYEQGNIEIETSAEDKCVGGVYCFDCITHKRKFLFCISCSRKSLTF
jgi:hypothetical protein